MLLLIGGLVIEMPVRESRWGLVLSVFEGRLSCVLFDLPAGDHVSVPLGYRSSNRSWNRQALVRRKVLSIRVAAVCNLTSRYSVDKA
jgi:hypothetical protein